MAQIYFAILTAIGEAKLANATALGITLQLTKMAVGDGNGATPIPSRNQIALVHENRRAPLNTLFVDPANASQIVAEQIIPEDIGGWWIRELGLYDAAGDLCAVANCPDTYKPVLASGSGRTQIIRMVLIVANTAAVELKVDPSVVLAPRGYVDQTMAAHTAAADPHPQYATDADLAAHNAAADPHPQYLTSAEGDAKVAAAVAALVASSPATLDTLDELAAALGDDPSFATTIINALAGKAALAGSGAQTFNVANAAQSQHAVALGQLLSGAGIPAGIPLDWSGLTPPVWAVVRNGSALSRATYASLFTALCPQRNGTLTNGANTVTGLATTLDMWVGMPVEGVGVPAGATVASITSSSAITLSANATASGVQTLTLFPFGYGSGGSATTFGVPDDRGLHTRAYDSGRGYEQSTLTANTTNASNVLTGISSTRGLYVGMPVSGAGIPASTTISEIVSGVSVKLSANATATASAVALTVTGRQVGAEGSDEIRSHTHLQQAVSSGSSGGYPAAFGATGVNGIYNNAYIQATGGPENNVKRRIYLPIITLGA